MRGRPKYILPSSAYLTRVVLGHHPLDAMAWYGRYTYGFFPLNILFSPFTLSNQTVSRCTNPLPPALISRITFKSSQNLPSYISLFIYYVIMELQRVRRPEGPQDWDAHRAVITDLYIAKGLELEDLMKTMEDDHFFKATYDHVDGWFTFCVLRNSLKEETV